MHSLEHHHEFTDVQHASKPGHDGASGIHLQAAVAAGRPDVLGAGGLVALQRSAGNTVAAGVMEEERSPVHEVISASGSSLEEGVRTDMEARMGHDFSDVKIHTGEAADASARSVSAHAYTVGNNIVFQRGAYDPSSSSGQTLLAHELTHVVQQRNGPVEGTPSSGGVSVSDPSDRFEREATANAEKVMAQPMPVQASHDDHSHHAGDGHDHGPSLQRQEAEEEVQTSHDTSLRPVQREEAEEETQA